MLISFLLLPLGPFCYFVVIHLHIMKGRVYIRALDGSVKIVSQGHTPLTTYHSCPILLIIPISPCATSYTLRNRSIFRSFGFTQNSLESNHKPTLGFGTIERTNAGHSPFISQPEWLAEKLIKAAENPI